jgi:hypothetical protein
LVHAEGSINILENDAVLQLTGSVSPGVSRNPPDVVGRALAPPPPTPHPSRPPRQTDHVPTR